MKLGVRTDKRKYTAYLVNHAIKAAAQLNIKELHNATEQLAGKCNQTCRPVQEKEGNHLTKKDN